MHLLPFVVFFITVALLPGIPVVDALTVKLLANTDICHYDRIVGKDFCYSTYEFSGLVAYEPQKTAFQFKTARSDAFLSHVSGLEYTLSVKKEGSKTLLNMTAWKMPWDSVDNVLCYEGFCFYEYSWWNASRPYHIRIDFNVSDGYNLTDYPVYLGNLTFKGDFNSSCNGNFSDIWFYSNLTDNATLLPYCMGIDCQADDTFDLSTTTCVINQSCMFWVRIPNINGSVYMSWGDNSSLNYSSSSVFSFIDNFDDGIINTTTPMWGRRHDAGFTETNGYLNFSGSGNRWISSWYNVTYGYIMETYAKTSQDTSHFINILGSCDVGTYSFYPDIYLGVGNTYYQGWGPGNVGFETWATNSWHTFAQYYNDSYYPAGGSFVRQNNTRIWLKLNVTNPGNIGLSMGQNGLYPTENWLWNFIRVRKYHYPEPKISLSGIMWDWNGTIPAAGGITINITNIANIYCYTEDYLYVSEPCVDNCSTMAVYLRKCPYGCTNFSLAAFGQAACIESPVIQFIEILVILAAICLLLYFKERGRL